MSAAVKTSSGHDKLLLFFCAAAIRVGLAIAFPGLPDLLTGRVEVSTPVNSFKRRMSMSRPINGHLLRIEQIAKIVT